MAKAPSVLVTVRIKAPDEIDPYVIEAELARTICSRPRNPMAAELALLPTWHRARTPGTRRYAFVALLASSGTETPDELARAAETAWRKALHERFGPRVSARVRTPDTPDQLTAYWCSVRGTPRRV